RPHGSLHFPWPQIVGCQRQHHRTAGAKIQDELAHVPACRLSRFSRVETFVEALGHFQSIGFCRRTSKLPQTGGAGGTSITLNEGAFYEDHIGQVRRKVVILKLLAGRFQLPARTFQSTFHVPTIGSLIMPDELSHLARELRRNAVFLSSELRHQSFDLSLDKI